MDKKIGLLSIGLLCASSAMAASTYELERTIEAQSQLLNQYEQSIIGLQNEVDILRGQLQENTYRLDETIKRQKMILHELDAAQPKGTSANTNVSVLGADEAEWKPSGNDKQDYEAIVGRILKGKDIDTSIAEMQYFIKTYPTSTYISNGYYWLGQLNYQQKRRNEASYYFASVVKKYPQSPKAAESMFKIGTILQEEGKKDKARIIFEQILSKYPNDTAILEKVKAQLMQK